MHVCMCLLIFVSISVVKVPRNGIVGSVHIVQHLCKILNQLIQERKDLGAWNARPQSIAVPVGAPPAEGGAAPPCR